ncbi:hypothetical protein J132_06446 [Termitomyces sp. J132]|nr:hypothetical protein J132_06446 [Termitomyces sp. J132]
MQLTADNITKPYYRLPTLTPTTPAQDQDTPELPDVNGENHGTPLPTRDNSGPRRYFTTPTQSRTPNNKDPGCQTSPHATPKPKLHHQTPPPPTKEPPA